MFRGVFRKLSLPFLFLSILAWILFVIGFGFRNARYQEIASSTAVVPEYIFFWLFMCSAPVLYILSFIQTLWESKIPGFLASIFVLPFAVSVGAVLFYNSLTIYTFYQDDPNVNCTDTRIEAPLDIFQEDKYVTIEFAGTTVSIFFYWVYMMMVPLFSMKTSDDSYGSY